MHPVFVLGNHTAALHVIRSLGEKGIPVYLAHKEKLCIGRFSKYCQGFLHCPDFTKHPDDFLDFLLAQKDNPQLQNAVLIPTNDDTNKIVSQNKQQLETYFTVPVAEWEIVNNAYDKRRTLEAAKQASVPIPQSLFPENLEEMQDHLEGLQFPVVVKPAMGKQYYYATKQKMHIADDREEVVQYFQDIARVVGEENLIIQEYIPGDNQTLYNYACCMQDGIPYGIFTGKKIRQYPRDFGTGTAAMTVHDEELSRLGTALLQACNYKGLAYIEFKKDPRDNQYKLIEINPRVWNFIDLAMITGVDLPYIFYLFAIGESLPHCRMNGELFWTHFWLDIGTSFIEMLKGRESLRTYAATMNGGKKYAVLSKNDPLPFLVETLILPYLYWVR